MSTTAGTITIEQDGIYNTASMHHVTRASDKTDVTKVSDDACVAKLFVYFSQLDHYTMTKASMLNNLLEGSSGISEPATTVGMSSVGTGTSLEEIPLNLYSRSDNNDVLIIELADIVYCNCQRSTERELLPINKTERDELDKKRKYFAGTDRYGTNIRFSVRG